MRKVKRALAFLLGGAMTFSATACDIFNKELEEDGVGQIILEQKQYVLFLEDGESSAKLGFSVYDNAVLQENAKVSYEVENSSVAKIEGDNIIANGIGKTRINVKYKKASATAEVSVVGEVTQEQVNTFNEEYVNIYGRTYMKDGKLCLDNPGSTLETAVSGGTVSAQIEVDSTMYICVEVDGVRTKRMKLTANQTEYEIASGLDDGFHVVRIVNSSEAAFGQIRLCSVSANEFYNAPEKADFFVEFIGDSITAGYGSIGQNGDVRTVDNSDACSTYAYLTAKNLGVDFSTIAVSGICVTGRVWDSNAKNMEEVYPCYSPLNANSYEFKRSADVVVLNLGTNDHAYTIYHPEYKTQFPYDYVRFLQFIRAKNPNAYILCLYGFASKDATISNGIEAAVQEMNDSKIRYLSEGFPGDGSGVNGHPPASAQRGWAKTLAAYIQNLMYLGN